MTNPRGLRTLAIVPLTLLGAALFLRALDETAVRALGHPRGITRHQRLDAAEARLGGRLLLPAYFPDDLAWPPSQVLSAGTPAAVCLGFRGRPDGRLRAWLCQAAPGRTTIPELLLAPAPAVGEQSLLVHGQPARIRTLRGDSGEAWQDLAFVEDGRSVVLRFQGNTDRMLRLAESLRRGRP